MRSASWAALLRHIPEELYNQLVIVTTGGTEIAVGGLLRVDRELVVLKGRLAGSEAGGRALFVPYSQIDYIGFQRPLKESEFHEIFGDLAFPTEGEPQPVAPSQALPEPVPAEPPPEAPAGPGARPASCPRLPIKSAVLERFRQRTATITGIPGQGAPEQG
jgi:hypothetical protein